MTREAGTVQVNQNWLAEIVQMHQMSSEDEKRLLRILTVLQSADMLEDLTQDELLPLLNAIAAALR